MKLSHAGATASLLLLSLVCDTGLAQGQVDFGKLEYATNCASCHGDSAKGDGPMRPYLTRTVPDLTTLARLNGGVFPHQRVWESIDGRSSVMIGSHGAREMPVWGYVFRADDTQPHDLYARSRIASLLDYLARMQVR